MKNQLSKEKGVSLIPLIIVIIVIGIITTIILNCIRDNRNNSVSTEEKTYNENEKVDFKYIDGVKIYEGAKYVRGDKSTGIVIELDGNEYTWINVNKKIKAISELEKQIKIDSDKKEEFISSINAYKGYYYNALGDVKYFNVDDESIWCTIYDKEGEYQDENGNIAFIPKGYQVCRLPSMNTIKTGLVIRDASNIYEKYLWIEVPRQVVQNANGDLLETSEEIEKSLYKYLNGYRQLVCSDTYYEGCIGANKFDEYNNLKDKMYQSIKNKGGFWVNINRSKTEKKSFDAYNEIHIEDDDKTVSLMFGIQWDLMCKFIDETRIDILNDITGSGEITLESTVDNKIFDPANNKTVIRGKVNLKDRNLIPYNQTSYYRSVIY